MIYLRFITEEWSLESALIRYGTHSWASHVEFLDTANMMTIGARLQGGVDFRRYDYCKPTAEAWFVANRIVSAYEWAVTQRDKPYDLTGLLSVFLLNFTERNWREDKKWWCSELVAAAFEAVGAPLLSPYAKPWKLSPGDLLNSKELTLVRKVK